ncbi:histone H1.4-like [Antechinus flavipes]|uniref:histone H1.4-like n=1 Tax=Antechinus flavipes TaxID=38775 RepID=UPI0022355BD0|nr:histone H1.4-like [Antechinus flavipes]
MCNKHNLEVRTETAGPTSGLSNPPITAQLRPIYTAGRSRSFLVRINLVSYFYFCPRCMIMSETAPAASSDPGSTIATAPPPVPAEKAPTKKAKKGGRPKAVGPPVSELITKAVGASTERNGVSLAALKKILAASGYDVEKNNSRIKLGLKSLVNKGTLVQTKGTGASGSFRLNKKVSSGETKSKAKKSPSVKAKKPASKKPKKAPGSATVKSVKTPKKAKKPAVVGAKKTVKSPKTSKAAKPKKVIKSPAKAKAVKPKAKVAKSKAVKPKKVLPKKK